MRVGENPQLKLTIKDSGQALPLKSTGNDSTHQLSPSSGDYVNLKNKPQLNGVTLIGDKPLSDFGIAAESDIRGFYTKPADGIPATDIAEGVIPDVSGFYTKPADGIPATDIASGVIPDVTDKADKVSSPTENNFAALDANGNLKDSGHKHGDYLTEHQDISGKVDKAASDQWINGGGSSTQLGVACATSNMYAFIRADGEGGNVHLRNGSNTVEFDSQPLNDGGTGAARIFVKTGANEAKNFYFKQNGNFQDGNGLTLGGLNYNKAEESTSAIVLKGSTSNKNVAKGKFVIWDGSLYVTKAAIASGDTLSTSTNLTAVSDGGFNLLSKAFIVEEYSFDYSGLADGGYKAVSASDLGISAKQGYTLAGFIGYASGSYNIYVYGVMPNTSGTVLSLRNKSGTSVSTTVTCRVVGLWIRNELL